MQNFEFIGLAFWKAFIKWQKNCNRVLKKHNLTQTQFTMLSILDNHLNDDIKTNQNSLAVTAGMDKMTASKILRGLEVLKFIQRKDHPTDSRAKIITLSKLGKTTLDEATVTFREFDDNFFSKLKKEKKFKKELIDLTKFKEKI